MKINWGIGITATYIAFATATSGFVAFAMSRPVSLVRPDYYEESLREDQQLAAIRNAQALGTKLRITYEDGDRIRVRVPASHAHARDGSVTFYRASDVAADRTRAFVPDTDGVQIVDVHDLARGLWLVQLRWSVDGRDYYYEQAVTLK